MSDESSSIRATRIGGHAYRYLTTRPHTGRVVSSFSGGINLLFEDGEAFVPVQTHAIPLHPWAIEIPEDETLACPEGTPVTMEAGELLVGGTRIVLSSVQVEELSLPRFSAEGIAIVQRNFPVLLRFVDEAQKMYPPDPFQQEIEAILACWHESGDPGILLDLIGLGAGSTPSGDDVLVGILAGLSILEKVSRKEMQQLVRLRSGIQARVKGRTPLPSAQMLLATCEQSFGEPILEFIEEITLSTTSEDGLLEKIRSVYQLGLFAVLGTPVARQPRTVPHPADCCHLTNAGVRQCISNELALFLPSGAT
jgi:hypothetical protein